MILEDKSLERERERPRNEVGHIITSRLEK